MGILIQNFVFLGHFKVIFRLFLGQTWPKMEFLAKNDEFVGNNQTGRQLMNLYDFIGPKNSVLWQKNVL